MHFLYAEDNPVDADLLCAHFALAAPDVRIEVVQSGHECLKRLADGGFDLLLLDNHLTDMDGLDVLHELRAAGWQLPVVLITGGGDDMTVWRALQEGADDYVPKACGYLETLPALLCGVARRHRSRGLLGSVDGSSRSHRILYVEPNPMDAELTVANLAASAPDLELHVVGSGDEALACMAQGGLVDLVLTDLRLQGMSALELLRGARHAGVELPFVIITGRGDETTAVALLRQGAYDYIVKRDNYLLQLPHALRHALQRFRLDSTTRALQADLLLLNAQLEEKVALRTAELQTEARARLRAQRELQRSAELLRMASRMARLGAWVVELPRRRWVWSADLAAAWDIPAGELATLDDLLRHVQEPWRARLQARLDACMREGAPFDEEVQVETARGQPMWIRVAGQAIADAAGRIARVQGTLQDIGERKQAEFERQELEARLRESQKLEAIGTFAGGIAHDFNNMLGAILGLISLARDDVPAEHPVQGHLGQIHRTAIRGRELVQKILTFSRRQPAAVTIQPLRPLVEDTLAMLRPMLPAMVRLDTCMDDEPLWIEADGTQIHQVVMNLCVNAWHAMRGGSGCIQIGLTAQARSEGAQDPTVPHAHLWVRDDGVGMDAATRGRIFEPFFTTRSGQGTGLGLAVVHGIVLAHRGSITVDSTPGIGSTFHVHFPLQRPPAAVATVEPTATSDIRDASGRHVLYVDDDEVMALMVHQLLQRRGYRVTVVQDSRAALDALVVDRHPFDIVVCDYNMPHVSGVDIARALAETRPELPVIISSGYLPDDARKTAIELGVRALLRKEDTFDELDGLIRRLLHETA